jgi:hypothetical protein
MNKLKSAFLIIGMVLLLIGAGLSFMQYQPWANYVLIAGAAFIIIRGFFHGNDKINKNNDTNNGV